MLQEIELHYFVVSHCKLLRSLSIACLFINLATFIWIFSNELQVGFYDRSCSAIRGIIQQLVSKAFAENSLIESWAYKDAFP